jgi:phosphoribosylanthranilate isomerase
MNTSFPSRVRVKICGFTSEEDALRAIELGADALGFNFFPGSKRYLPWEEHLGWIGRLPPLVTKVALLVNAPLEEALRIADLPAIDLVQFHGDEDAAYCERFARSGREFIKAIRLAGAADLETAESFSTPNILLDAHVPGAFGGTGSRINLELAGELVRRYPRLRVFLAGGLTPENVEAAKKAVRPYALDVASGVERDPRRKCPELMGAFLRAAWR